MAITFDEARKRYTYNPDTGAFTRNSTSRKWIAGSTLSGTESHGYMRVWVNGKQLAAHRLAWLWMTGEWPSTDIDHIDGNRSNNSWSNLRQVDRSTNLENIRSAKSHNKSTGLLGAYHSPTKGRFVSRIQVRGKSISLGSFATADAAHAAYLSAKKELHKGSTL